GPQHVIVPGPTGFPPAQAQPGAVGEAGYSPLIQLPDGVVVHAPQIANDTGQADKVIRLDIEKMTVTYVETTGFYDGTPVHYASFEDRKSTRLNSSHGSISYAVFCST